MNQYIKVAVSYKFKPEGEMYKQAHYREVTPEEHFHTVKIDTFHMFSNLFDKLVYLEGANVTEVSELEYQATSLVLPRKIRLGVRSFQIFKSIKKLFCKINFLW